MALDALIRCWNRIFRYTHDTIDVRLLKENQDAWESLVFALSELGKPALTCLTCSNAQTEAFFLKKIQSKFPLNHVLDLRQEKNQIHSLFNYIRDHAQKEDIDGYQPNFFIHVFGLDYQFSRQVYGGNLLDRINFERELLFQKLPFSTIFWINPAVEKLWKQQSSDFWNWVTYDFQFNDSAFLQKKQAVDPLPKSINSSKESRQPVRIFISYAYKDSNYLLQLEKHLAPLVQNKLIEVFSDRYITPGEKFAESIRKKLSESEVILLLISPDFFDSDYIQDVEMKIAFKRQREGGVVIIPIILRYTDWKTVEQLRNLIALPEGGKPVASFSDPDIAMANIVQAVRKLAEK